MANDIVHNCHICARFGAAKAEDLAWSDEHWVAGAILGVPGWVMVATREHTEGSWALSDDQVAGMGSVLRSLTSAVRQVAGAERVHMIAQGETALHFHYLIMARRPGEVPVFNGAELGRRAPALADPAKAALFDIDVRMAALAKTSDEAQS
jgi:diadenosine tetraphosphate (Ap4A) HIT family hydrolase